MDRKVKTKKELLKSNSFYLVIRLGAEPYIFYR